MRRMSEMLPEQPISKPEKPRKARSRRRWFQFGLGSLLVLVTLCGVLLAAWRAYLAPYRAQRDTMALIERLKGNYQTQEAASWANRLSLAPADNVVLVNLADCDQPADYIDAVSRLPSLETLIVGGLAFGDEHVARLKKLSTLRLLVLDSTSVTATGIEALRWSLPEVRAHHSERRAIAAFRAVSGGVITQSSNVSPELVQLVGPQFVESATRLLLFNTDATDAALAHLAAMKNLQEMELGSTQVTDAALPHLAGLNNLERLCLGDTVVTDSGLAHLAALKNLVSLRLDGTKITDTGLAHLAALQELQTLDVHNTQVTDRGLAQVAALKNLQTLVLDDTVVTDAGLVHLAGQRNLSRLFIRSGFTTPLPLGRGAVRGKLPVIPPSPPPPPRNAQVTAAGLAKLRQALPDCDIIIE
jgi:hypothetical protein